jgi:3-hydroxyacyl-[acyl-carrier-protein] dehydratase
MLRNDFFTIISWSREGDSIAGFETGQVTEGDLRSGELLEGGKYAFKASLAINAGHPIFEGHFPGQPVVPGACLMQMVKEITETILGRELRLSKADQLKFVAMIDPHADNVLEMEITILIKESGQADVSASLLNKGAVGFKFSGVFRGLSA